MTPSIDTAKRLASFLNTTVGYLLGETEDDNLLKDHDMIQPPLKKLKTSPSKKNPKSILPLMVLFERLKIGVLMQWLGN